MQDTLIRELVVMKSHYVLLLFLTACAPPAERPPAEIRPAPVDGGVTASTPMVVADAPVFAGTILSVGEAIVVDGDAIVEGGNPSSAAIDYRMTVPSKLVVVGRKPGDAGLRLRDGTTRAFRVVADPCRERPSHPAIVLDVEDHAEIERKGIRQVEALLRNPWPAVAHAREGGFVVTSQSVGRTTVMVTTDARTVELYDVLVGVCADRGYASVAPAIPPGDLGPKGDGTCVRRHKQKETPATCPEPSKLEALPDPALSPIACDWAASCGRMGDEGCCVGCKNPFRMKIGRACALRALRAKSCADVLKILDAPSCAR